MTCGHFRTECRHGFIYSQCRCPSLTKTVRLSPCPDDESHRGLSWAVSASVESPKIHDEGSGL